MRGFHRIVFLVLILAVSRVCSAANRDMPDQTVAAAGTGEVTFTKLRLVHALGLTELGGAIRNSSGREQVNLRFHVIMSDKNGEFKPKIGPLYVQADEAVLVCCSNSGW